MRVESCIPVIPSADLEKSLRFWVEGLGLKVDREMRQDGKLIGCMVHNNQNVYIWLNQRLGTAVKPENFQGIRLYWAPSSIQEMWERLKQLGYPVSDIVRRDYGQIEFSSRTTMVFHIVSVLTQMPQMISGHPMPKHNDRPHTSALIS